MSHAHKISLRSAILINLNIMAGAGIFVNIVDITRGLQTTSGLLYLLVGLFMFPLIFTFAQLVKLYPSGGFYAFAQPISPLLGFISNWTYFFGKLASSAFLLFTAASFVLLLFPSVSTLITTLQLSFIVLTLFILLNLFNIKIGAVIQNCFFIAKSIPMLCVILLGIYYFDINSIAIQNLPPLTNFITLLPLVLYCFSGFEAACSISRQIENPEQNAPKAIFYSFFSIILLYIAFQTLISMMLLPNLHAIANYTDAYPYLVGLVPTSLFMQQKLMTMISFLIGFSAMGAAYGLLFSNSWNLYTLAQNKHTFAHKTISALNKHHVPAAAVLIEGLVCAIFLFITQGNKIELIQIATLGCTITYTISTIAALRLGHVNKTTGILALITCIGFIISCIISSFAHQFVAIKLFACIIATGCGMYYVSLKKS